MFIVRVRALTLRKTVHEQININNFKLKYIFYFLSFYAVKDYFRYVAINIINLSNT